MIALPKSELYISFKSEAIVLRPSSTFDRKRFVSELESCDRESARFCSNFTEIFSTDKSEPNGRSAFSESVPELNSIGFVFPPKGANPREARKSPHNKKRLSFYPLFAKRELIRSIVE